MADKKMYIHLDMNNNEVKKVLLEKLASAPTGVEGKIYYDTTDKVPYLYDGSSWIDLSGDVKDVQVAGGVLSVASANGVYTITLNASDIDHSAITDDEPTKHREINDAGNGATDLLSAQKILALLAAQTGIWIEAVIDQVDATAVPPTEVSGDRYLLLGTPHANWDGAADGDVVEFDGTNWIVESVDVGVMVDASADATTIYQKTAVATWIAKQWESTPDASDTVKGKIEIATQSEVDAGTETAMAVTPATLRGSDISRSYRGAITWVVDGTGYKAEFTNSTHALGAKRLNVTVYENDAEIGVDVESTTAGLVTVRANTNPANCTILIEG